MEAQATEQLESGIRHFQAGLGAIDFRRHGIFQRLRLRCGMYPSLPATAPGSFDFGEHLEEMLLNELVFAKRLAALHTRFWYSPKLVRKPRGRRTP